MQILNNAESIESSTIRQLLAYWRSKSRDGGIPARADIDPAEIVTILPNLMIVDFERDPFRVQFRLVGTRVVEVTGFEFTGMYLDEIAMPDVEESFLECYEAACRTRQPMFERITWRFDDQTTGDYDFCVLPLDDNGEWAARALAAECYERLEKQYDLSKIGGRFSGAVSR